MFNLRKKTTFDQIQLIIKDHKKQLEKKGNQIPKDVLDVTTFLLNEIYDVFHSMSILMRKKDFVGCSRLARTIFENSINIQYIYKKDTEKRAEDFKKISLENMVKKIESLDKNETFPGKRDIHDLLKENLNNFKNDKNIRDRFKEVDLEDMYIRSYKRLSEYIHSIYRAYRPDYTENRPYIQEMKRIIRSETCLVTLIALKEICIKYNLDGGIMILDDPGYKGAIFFSTNPEKHSI